MSSPSPERILIVQNPVCSRPQAAEKVIGWFKDSPWWQHSLDVLQTRPPSEGSNIDLIREALEPGDIVLGLGGDGLANDMVNAIAQADEAGEVGADEVAMVPCPTGNGNDLSRSIYGRNILARHGRRLWEIVDRGEEAWLDAMKLDAEGVDRFVHSYIGFGFTAQAAFAINQPHYRQRRGDTRLPARALDADQVIRLAFGRRRQPFVYENGNGPVEAQEILYALMPRIAAGVIRLDTKPFDGQVVRLEVGSRQFLPKAASKIGAGMFGGAQAEVLTDERHELELKAPTAVQYDGEPAELPASTVAITHHRQVVKTLV